MERPKSIGRRLQDCRDELQMVYADLQHTKSDYERVVVVLGEAGKQRQADMARIARMEADLLECFEYFKDRQDIVDGDYGEPAPNKEMQLASMIEETLYGRPL